MSSLARTRAPIVLVLAVGIVLGALLPAAFGKTEQWIVEQPSDIHEAANRGATPVVLYLATLLKDGARLRPRSRFLPPTEPTDAKQRARN